MIFSCFQRASLSRYISFSHSRLLRTEIKELVVEVGVVGFVNQDVLRRWSSMMLEHNRIIERGQRMKLQHGPKNLDRLKFSCVDLYMLQMQSKHIANRLDAFSSFGERVLLLIRESPAALFWIVGGPILVERLSWCRLCAEVMALIHALGMGDQQAPPLQLSPWPDRALLEAAITRATGVFGLFARADAAAPSIRSLLLQTADCRTTAHSQPQTHHAAPSSAGGAIGSSSRRPLAPPPTSTADSLRPTPPSAHNNRRPAGADPPPGGK